MFAADKPVKTLTQLTKESMGSLKNIVLLDKIPAED